MIRVAIADDHPFVRRGVCETLDEAPDIEVVAEAETGDDLIRIVRDHADLDVVVTDLSMPGVDGIEVVARLHAERPNLPVLALSTHGSREVGVQVLEAGGVGYVEKAEAPERLVEAVRTVAGGGRYLSPTLATALTQRVLGFGKRTELSVRELQVVRAIASGQTRTQVAEGLSLSPSTVSTYKRRVLEKLGLTTDAELGLYALKQGLVDP